MVEKWVLFPGLVIRGVLLEVVEKELHHIVGFLHIHDDVLYVHPTAEVSERLDEFGDQSQRHCHRSEREKKTEKS